MSIDAPRPTPPRPSPPLPPEVHEDPPTEHEALVEEQVGELAAEEVDMANITIGDPPPEPDAPVEEQVGDLPPEDVDIADMTVDDPPPEEPDGEVAGPEPPGADVVEGWSRLTQLPADATIDAGRYRFETDDLGRIAYAEGDLHLSPGVRQSADAATVREMMTPDVRDQAGHLIGNRFEGPGDNWNMVLQDANLNVSEWKVLENSWAKALEEGRSVQVEIGLSYHERDVRPYAFNVSYTVDGGEAVQQDILNAPSAASVLER